MPIARETWRQGYGQESRRIGRLTGDRSAGWGHLLPPIIRSSAGDGSVWWHTLIFHFHFYSTCCLGVRNTNREPRMKEKDSHTRCFHHDHHCYCSVALLNLIFVCHLLPFSEDGNEIDCSRFVLLFETTAVFSDTNTSSLVDIF